jgi:hypothetical protein
MTTRIAAIQALLAGSRQKEPFRALPGLMHIRAGAKGSVGFVIFLQKSFFLETLDLQTIWVADRAAGSGVVIAVHWSSRFWSKWWQNGAPPRIKRRTHISLKYLYNLRWHILARTSFGSPPRHRLRSRPARLYPTHRGDTVGPVSSRNLQPLRHRPAAGGNIEFVNTVALAVR